MKKATSILLVIALILTVFVSCNGDVDERLFGDHEHYYEIKSDGHWECIRPNCNLKNKLLAGTDKPYITVVVDGQPTEIIQLTGNPNVGKGTLTVGSSEITYVNTSGTAQEVVIRTNSFETLLVISASKDTVNHYGFAFIADVQSINSASYHEHGTVGRLKVAQGHAVVESTGTVFCAMETAETANIENNNGKIYTETTKDANNGNEHVTQKENGVFEAAYLDCGYGHHNMQKLVVDETHTYEVCTACGYTVKVAGVEAGAVVYHTSDGKTAVASDPVVTVDSTSGEVTVNTESATTPIVAGDVNNDIDVEKVNNCEHTFVYADEDGLCVGTCSKCGLKTVQEHHYWDLDGENVGEGAKCVQCGEVPISGVCKIGKNGYDTLKEAVAAVPTDGTLTTVTMIANYGFTENIGVVISNGQNIVFDMNGFVLASDAPIASGAALFTVNGKMTVKDSSDTNNDGTGKGKITTHIQEPDQAKIPGYASNTFYVNGGELILESGIVENYSWNPDWGCGASYCVDIGGWVNPAKDSIFTMNGGRLIGEYADQAVRVNNQTGTSCKCIFNMTGGVIESGGFWLQQGGGSSTPGEINISGGVVNGLIDLACFNKETDKVVISGDAIINCTNLRIRRFGGDGTTSTQSADKFVIVSCKEFNVTTFDSNVEKNYTKASEYKIFISIDDNTTLSGVATQLK